MANILIILLVFCNYAICEKNWTLFLDQGEPLDAGYHGYLVIFIKKENSLRFGFSNLLCSGTIINQRWILTRAHPISSLPIGSYYAASQLEISQGNFNQIDINYVAVHPEYAGETDATDLAMAKTTKYLNFNYDLLNVNLVFDTFPVYNNCKLITWSMVKYYGRDTMALRRSEINLNPQNRTYCPKDMHCFSGYKHGICGYNGGAPLMCDFMLSGIFIGFKGILNCQKSQEINAIFINQTNTIEWLRTITSTIPYDPQNEEYLIEKRKERYKICKSCSAQLPQQLVVIQFVIVVNHFVQLF